MSSGVISSGLFKDLYFEVHGSGNPVLVLHGLGATHYSWRYLVGPLSESRSVYLFDLKGHGKSKAPNDGRYSLEEQADILWSFIRDFDLRDVSVIGHSMGGGIALLLCLRMLQETPSRLTSLVLLDSIAYLQKLPIMLKLLRFPFVGNLALSIIPADVLAKIVLNLAYYDRSKITDETIRCYASNLSSRAGRKAILSTVLQIIPTNIGWIAQQYEKISVPTLIIWGQDDKIVSPAIGILLNTQIKNSVLTIMERCGHIPQEEQPSRTIPEICEFLGCTRMPCDV